MSPEDAAEETTEFNTSKLREKIMEETEKLRGCVIGSRSMSKLMCKFESRLEAALSRMAILGTVEELDEPESECECDKAEQNMKEHCVDEAAEMDLSLASDKNVVGECDKPEQNMHMSDADGSIKLTNVQSDVVDLCLTINGWGLSELCLRLVDCDKKQEQKVMNMQGAEIDLCLANDGGETTCE